MITGCSIGFAVPLALALLALPGSLAADAQAAAPAGGSIAGTLTAADSGRPVRKAKVTVACQAPRVTRTTTSDAQGRYLFENLPACDYSLTASKPGYLDTVLGARRPGAAVPGTPLKLAAGQTLGNIALKVPRGGVISGIITDEFGDPAFGVPVRALRLAFSNGERTTEPAGNAVTDDLGAYRIAGLLPGDYVVSAVPRDTVAGTAATAESLRARQAQIMASGDAAARARIAELKAAGSRVAGRPDPVGYVPVYFPGTPAPSAAGRIALGIGAHAGGIDIQLQSMRTGTVSGIVHGGDGLPTRASVQLLDPLMPIAGLAVWFRHPGTDGRFTFEGIAPGTYALRAQGTTKPGEAGDGQLTAATSVVVTEGSVSEASVRLGRGVSVAGTLDLATLTAPVELARVRVELFPILTASDWEAPVKQGSPDPTGRFAIEGVAEGSYRVRVTGLPDGWSIASAVFDDRDAMDFNLEIQPGKARRGGLLKFTPRTGEIAGAVTDASGDPVADRTVLLFPDNHEQWVPQSRRIHLAQPGSNGRYAIRGLPPGDYRIAAINPPEPGQHFDRTFLAQVVGGSTPVTLAAGDTRTQDLRVR